MECSDPHVLKRGSVSSDNSLEEIVRPYGGPENSALPLPPHGDVASLCSARISGEAKANSLNPYASITAVVYHHLSEERHWLTEGLGVVTRPETFRAHVKYYAKNYDLIQPSDLVGRRLPRKPLLITFDDVYRSVLDFGAGILKEVNANAIWFLNPASLIEETLPFDNLLALAAARFRSQSRPTRSLFRRARAISAAGYITKTLPYLAYSETTSMCHTVAKALGIHQAQLRRESGLFLEAHEVPKLEGYGIEVGNHSLSHRFLRCLDENELREEILVSQDHLVQLSGRPVRFLAIPYGNQLDATELVLAMARGSSHQATFLVHARLNSWRPANDVLYRIGPGDTSVHLLPSMLGVLPAVRTAWNLLR